MRDEASGGFQLKKYQFNFCCSVNAPVDSWLRRWVVQIVGVLTGWYILASTEGPSATVRNGKQV